VNAVSGGSTTPHFTGYDGLGTVRLLTDGSGAVSDRYAYEAFGGVLWQTGSTANAYQFTGERFNSDLGLYYLRARWYNQGTGRFLTRDTYPLNAHHPIEWNRYVYTANNPVNWTDPSGLLIAEQIGQTAQIVRSIVIATIATAAAVCVLRLSGTFLQATLARIALGGSVKLADMSDPCAFEREPASCDDENHKAYARCSVISGRYNIEGRADPDAIGIARVLTSDPLLTLADPQLTTDPLDPCAGTPGAMHWRVTRSDGSGYLTSIKECTCCEETEHGPKLITKCGFFGGHHRIFRDFMR
jgi:RHS repeat-associated protein